jgi:hypothetical protein
MPRAKTPRTTNGKTTTKTTTTATPEIQVAATPQAAVTAEPVKEVTKTVKMDAVKPEVKTTKRPEVRKNVFPINLDEEIRRRAYELSEQRGFIPGHETEDWLFAEREILARYTDQQQTA